MLLQQYADNKRCIVAYIRTITFVVLNSLNASVRSKLLLSIVCMQTIAANLGSMLTPLGNPQNLYLYGKSGMDMSSFVLLMLPYSIISLVLIAIWQYGYAVKVPTLL